MQFIQGKLKIGVVLLFSVGLISATVIGNNKHFEISKQIEIFANLYKELNTYYVDDLDPGQLMRTGIDAMLESLDPYTNYISEAQIEGYKYITEGKSNGIGANFKQINNYVVITEVFENSPALKAGLKAGDVIRSIDGQGAKDKSEYEVNEILKGFPGTEVDINIKRPGEGKEQKLTLVREEVNIPNVPYHAMISDGIGYVALTTFTRKAGQNVANALTELKKEHNLKGIILDLRNNGGGLLNEAVNVSNVFIAKDEFVASTKGKVEDWDRTYKTMNKPVDEQIPLAVLINKRSASASEIVSGVMQDLDRGILIGQKSFGKGLVQNTRDVGYNSKLKMTMAKYYIPSGRCIQGVEYENGLPVDIPDNKRTAFKTRNGRKVLDGGGVAPDVVLEKEEVPGILKNLQDQNIIFNYVTQYVLKHQSIAQPDVFSFSEYDDFIRFVQKEKFIHESTTEVELKKLKEALVKEGYSTSVQSEFTGLEKAIKAARENDIMKHKKAIITAIEQDIVSRYYYETGKIQNRLSGDEEVEKAIDVLINLSEYNKLLGK